MAVMIIYELQKKGDLKGVIRFSSRHGSFQDMPFWADYFDSIVLILVKKPSYCHFCTIERCGTFFWDLVGLFYFFITSVNCSLFHEMPSSTNVVYAVNWHPCLAFQRVWGPVAPVKWQETLQEPTAQCLSQKTPDYLEMILCLGSESILWG